MKPFSEAWADGLLGWMGWKVSRADGGPAARTGTAIASANWLVAWRAAGTEWPAASTAGEDVFACEVRTEAWTKKGGHRKSLHKSFHEIVPRRLFVTALQ